MLKTTSRDRVWFVTQPDHGQVAGYLAAHWGNGQFAKPGYYASVPDPERLRAEVILAIAQHDNGWWEWEATPGIADADNSTANWIEPDSLNSHGRLLQLLDGLSLSLCSNLIPTRSGEVKGLGEHEFELQHVPRRSWDDRVPIDVSPSTERKIILDPYPFDLDPLPVNVPARVFELPADRSGHFQTWWNTRPVEMIEFLYTSG